MGDTGARRVRGALVALFLAALFVPLGGLALRWGATVAVGENRTLAPLPQWPATPEAAREFPRAVERFVGDRFGLRDEMTALFNLFQLRLLAPKPSRWVVCGADDWLFLGRAVAYGRKAAPLDAARLDGWAALLAAKGRWLARRGVRYVFVVAPNKASVYPEPLPPELAPLEPTALDQLLARMAGEPDSPLVDLRAALRARAGAERLYHRTDTHWNDAGAALGAGAVLARLGLPVPGPGAFVRTRVSGLGLELARMLGLQYVLTEDYETLAPAAGGAEQTLAPGWLGREWKRYPVQLFRASGRGGRVALVGDSFVMGTSFAARVAEGFAAGVAVHRDLLRPDVPAELEALLDAARPDVLVEELVERDLLTARPDPAPFLDAPGAP
jgi:hypothetical protein